jgi:hypothetical protein
VVWLINQRARDVDGPIQTPEVLESAAGPKPTYHAVPAARVAEAVRGRRVVIAIHGFNVSRPKAVRAYATLEASLKLTADEVFFGVLWPGDAWIPVINYPAEAQVAVKCGAALAAFLDARMAEAAALDFISHSLGGRVLLEAVGRLSRPAREVCVTAGAVDSNVLSKQYLAARDNAHRVSVLASSKDKVLKLAYPLGDFGADVLFGDKDSPWKGALGLKGPKPTEVPPKVEHRQIPAASKYGHGDYFPPSDGSGAGTKWPISVAYMRRCIDGAPDAWP